MLGEIGTLKKTDQKKVDWDTLSYATSKAPGNRSWETRLAAKELTTGKVMHNQGSWSTPACPRNCGHSKEDTPHIIQYKKGDDTWEKLKKTLVRRGIKNRAEPTLIPDLLHGIYLWRKGNLPPLPPNLPTQAEAAINKQNNIGWLQALTGLLAHEWTET